MAVTYRIYSHFDLDGAISALLMKAHLLSTVAERVTERSKNRPDPLSVSNSNFNIVIKPVDHGPARSHQWFLTQISPPCAVLDFLLHPLLLTEKFFDDIDSEAIELGLKCYWIDHHETGGQFRFLRPDNLEKWVPARLHAFWDCTAKSTPGLMRTHFDRIGFSPDLIKSFERLIDIAEIVDGALYTTAAAAADFSDFSVQLQALFSTHHPLVIREKLYVGLIEDLIKTAGSDPRQVLNADPLYGAVLEYERILFQKKVGSYEAVLGLSTSGIAICDFRKHKALWHGMGRFIPYLIAPDCRYAIHISPPNGQGFCAITCGKNPWYQASNHGTMISDKVHLKPNEVECAISLGGFFSQRFSGGGHSYVAGGVIKETEYHQLDELVSYLG